MRTKLRPRYYCEHCAKSGASAGAMRRHEKGCTANPKRSCSHCGRADLVQQPIGELLAALDADIEADVRSKNQEYNYGEGLLKIPNLRRTAENCPVCILSAVRCRDCGDIDFDYQKEHASFWIDVNDAKAMY